MKVEQEKLPESKIRIKIEVPAEKVDEFINKAYFELSKSLNVPGFRSGHIPKPIIDQRVGTKAVYDEAVRLLVPHAYVEAIEQEKIIAIGRPEIKVTKFAPGNPANFEAEVAVVPEVKIGDYKNIKLKQCKIEVCDEEVDQVLKNLQKKEAKLFPKTEAIENGDWVEIDFDGFKGGVLMEKLKSRNHPFIMGEGVLLPDFEKNILGLKPEEEKEFDMTFPKDYYSKEFAGEKVHFKLKVLRAQKVELPELNDEFVKKITGNTDKNLEQLKEDIKAALVKQKEHEEKAKEESEVIKQVTEKAEVPVPAFLINEEVEAMKGELVKKLESQGLKMERYLEHLGKTEEEVKEGMKEDAERRIKVGLVFDKVAELENIEVSEDEADTEIKKTQQQMENSDKKVDSVEVRRYIKTVLRNRKTLDKLLEYANSNS